MNVKKNVFKTYAELEKAYKEHYVKLEYDNTLDCFDVNELSYELDKENQWIIKHETSGNVACGCEYCCTDSYEVVAWVEGKKPTQEDLEFFTNISTL